MYELVIRGATVVDGLGHDPRRAMLRLMAGGSPPLASSALTPPRSSMPAG